MTDACNKLKTTVDCASGAQGRTAEAIACYEQVALLHPDSADAHANLASSYKDAARQARAWQIALIYMCLHLCVKPASVHLQV